MAGKKIAEDHSVMFGIKVCHFHGESGWITGANGEVLSFSSRNEAEKFFKKLRSGNRYSWNVRLAEVQEIPPEQRG